MNASALSVALVCANHHPAGRPPKECRTHERGNDTIAGCIVHPPEAGCLSRRKTQAGHFYELVSDPFDEGVHVHDVVFLFFPGFPVNRSSKTCAMARA